MKKRGKEAKQYYPNYCTEIVIILLKLSACIDVEWETMALFQRDTMFWTIIHGTRNSYSQNSTQHFYIYMGNIAQYMLQSTKPFSIKSSVSTKNTQYDIKIQAVVATLRMFSNITNQYLAG